MGAVWFETRSVGETVEEAFNNAREKAQKHNSSDANGYHGDIRTVEGFTLLDDFDLDGMTCNDVFDYIYENSDEIGIQKWHKCAAVDLGAGYYLFAGWGAE